MNVAIVGMGLIGGSFFKAAQAAGHSVAGIHHGDTTGWERADLILVCLPPEAIVPWVVAHAPVPSPSSVSAPAREDTGSTVAFKHGAIVVDICGVKRPIMREMARHLARTTSHESRTTPSWTFVGGHPMAGREVSGFANSKADLFAGASMILTPFDGTPAVTIETLRAFFASVGFAETVVTTPEKHDDMIAFTSQLCHVIATTYSRDPRVKDAIGFSAGSYANMTRIATQDSDVWSALYQENRDALVDVLDGFAARFKDLRDAVAAGDVTAMKRLIDEGTKAKRQELLDRKRGDENV